MYKEMELPRVLDSTTSCRMEIYLQVFGQDILICVGQRRTYERMIMKPEASLLKGKDQASCRFLYFVMREESAGLFSF